MGKKETEERQTEKNKTESETKGWGVGVRVLECSCNQGLCTQEGPINPTVCLYISSGILKTAKNEFLGPGGLLGPLRESERERELQ